MSLNLVVSPSPIDHGEPLPDAVIGADIERDGTVAWLRIRGDVHRADAPQLARVLRRAQLAARLIVLDLRRMSSIDAIAAGVIAHAVVRARRGNRRLILICAPDHVDRALSLIAISDRPEIIDLEAGAPVVQALLALARTEHVASIVEPSRRSSLIDTAAE
ncbi:MAG: STAS domain-containing protein [Solirubrobacteraceae bacterium]